MNKHTNIKIALNFHAFGNNLNLPFNCDNDQNELLKDSHPFAYEYFMKFKGKAPEGASFGNRAQTSNGRKMNGEVSDYMFGKHKILALSPELGNSNIQSMTYYI